MKIYTLQRSQILPVTLQECWEFFSDPKNLPLITPPHMKFKILSMSGGEKMYEGQIIRYKVCPFPNIPVDWLTEITHVNAPYYFVDEQRSGPYKLWHHQHFFKEVQEGVEVSDEVNYIIPYGILGTLANYLFVEKQVSNIFDYRKKTLEKIFCSTNENRNKT